MRHPGLARVAAGVVGVSFIAKTAAEVWLLAYSSRVLGPVDFGLYSVCAVFVGAARSLFAVGFGPAVIQKGHISGGDLRAAWSGVFYISVLVWAVLTVCAAPLVSLVFSEPDVVVGVRTMLLSVLLMGMRSPGLMKAQQALKGGPLAWSVLLGTIGRVVLSIVLLSWSGSYLALVWGFVFGIALEVATGYALAPEMPSLRPEWTKWREFYRFSKWVHLGILLQWASRNLDLLVAGALLGVADLGRYNRAAAVSALPVLLMQNVGAQVVFPMLAVRRLNGDDGATLIRLLGLVRASGLLLCALGIVYSIELFGIILGAGWRESANVASLLLVGVYLRVQQEVLVPYFRAAGAPQSEFSVAAVRLVVSAVMLSLGAMSFGLLGVAIGSVIASGTGLAHAVGRVKKLQLRTVDALKWSGWCAALGCAALGAMVWARFLGYRWGEAAIGFGVLSIVVLEVVGFRKTSWCRDAAPV